MIELPESYVLAEQLNRTTRGKRIAGVTANHTPHRFAWFTGNPAGYHAKLAGKTITGAEVYSGIVRVSADDMLLLLGTPIRYHAEGEKPPEKHQLLLEFEDSSAMSCTVQMWGVLFCYRDGEEATGIPIQHIIKRCPSPLEKGFDRPYFERLATSERPRNLSAKAFLATEQRIPGFGNGVLQDVLWTAKIHPKRKMGTLSGAELSGLYDAVKTVLDEMRARGGRDTERDLFGREGGYRTIASKNTLGKPCPVCGTAIRKEAYMGGAVYYCGRCQPL